MPGNHTETLPDGAKIMGNSIKHQDAINAASHAQYLTPGLALSPSATLTGGLIVGILAACVGMALTPPKSRGELIGMLAASFGSSLFVGPLVIEYLALTHYGFQAQLGICFMVAAPAWLGWCVVSRQFDRWRKARNPARTIRGDLKR